MTDARHWKPKYQTLINLNNAEQSMLLHISAHYKGKTAAIKHLIQNEYERLNKEGTAPNDDILNRPV